MNLNSGNKNIVCIIIIILLMFSTNGFANPSYDPITGVLTLPRVDVNGVSSYTDVSLLLNPDGTYSVLEISGTGHKNRPVNAMMQADTGYSTDVSDDILQSMPERFLFRVKGPDSTDRISDSKLLAFADRIKSWEGSLCYSPDVDRHDAADWPGVSSSEPYEVYVDDMKSLNALLKQAGSSRQFDEIVIETEGSTLGGSPEVYQDMRTYMNTKGMNAIAIGVTVGWTKINAFNVDRTYVELYNIYASDPATGKELVDGNQSTHLCSPNGCLPALGQGSIYEVMNPTDAADRIVKILKLKYPNFSTLFDGLLKHTYFLFSYEPQFLGVSSPPALQPWNSENYSAFINQFVSQVKAEGLTDQTVLTGVYQSAPAFQAWDGQ